jgi:glycosyltransferase involved in cell wall biosynthesis
VPKQPPLISVICCAHNEERYVDNSLSTILKALKGVSGEVVFVADRCTDRTTKMAKKYPVTVIKKDWKKWKNSYAEALQTGYLKAQGAYVCIIDADIAVPNNFFSILLSSFKDDVASVAGNIVTYPDTFWNRAFYAWEKTYNVAPLGKEPYGAARMILKSALDEIGGFSDVPAPDTDLDLRLSNRGYKSKYVASVKTFHLRHLTLSKMANGQITSGRARYILGVSFKRTLGHCMLRCRPLVLNGWLSEWVTRKAAQKKTLEKRSALQSRKPQ